VASVDDAGHDRERRCSGVDGQERIVGDGPLLTTLAPCSVEGGVPWQLASGAADEPTEKSIVQPHHPNVRAADAATRRLIGPGGTLRSVDACAAAPR
jgi:hypothetical protein